jgi:hypothetical protein
MSGQPDNDCNCSYQLVHCKSPLVLCEQTSTRKGGLYDPDCDPPAAFQMGLVFITAPLEFSELVGLCHATS